MADSELDAAIDDLRFRVASRPSDLRAHSALAHLEMRAGRPGAAFRHLDLVRVQRALTRADRALLGRLYAERLDERLAMGDGQAYRDAERALELGAEVAPERRREAHFLAALVELRRGNQWGETRALAHLAAAERLAPGDARLAYRAPATAALDDLAHTLVWLYRGTALRKALTLSNLYFDRGGRDPRALRALVGARAWWGSAEDRHRIDRVLALELAAAGVSACPASARADDVGCAGTLWSVATGPADLAADVRARAALAAWPPVTDIEDARAFALLAIRAVSAKPGNMHDDRAFARVLRRRVDIDAVLEEPERLGTALPVLLMAAGRWHDAAAAIEAILPRADDAAELAPGDRVLLLFAAALVEHAHAPVVMDMALDAFARARQAGTDRPGPAGPDGPESELERDLLHIALMHARATNDDARVAALSETAARASASGPAWQRQVPWTEAATRVSALERALPSTRPDEVAGDFAPLDAARLERALVRVALAHLQDSAVGDRLAREFVDRAVHPGRHAPALAALYTALGDTGRALLWWQRVAEVQPRHTAHAFELAAALIVAGDLAQARVHLTAVAADSGHAGQVLLLAARWLAHMDHALESLYMSKRALGLVAPHERRPIIELAVAAMERLGRADEAEDLRAHLRGPGVAQTEQQPAATAHADPTDADAVLAWLETETARADPDRDAIRAALVRAAAWNPHDPRIAGALFAHLPAHDPAYQHALGAALATLASASAPNASPLSEPAARARETARVLRGAWRDLDAPALAALLGAAAPPDQQPR